MDADFDSGNKRCGEPLLTGPLGDEVDVIHLGDVGSTNDEALARLRHTGRPVWVRADRQLTGRGRRGRAWASPVGNLYVSFATALPGGLCDDAFAMQPLAAAVALADAIVAISPASPQLKWPNDVLLQGRKTAGILLEAEAGPPRRVVIGFGVNMAETPPVDGATCLADHAPAATPEILFPALQTAVATRLAALFAADGIRRIREAWLQRAVGIGHPVTVRFETTERVGRFVGLDPSGRLILADNSGNTELVAAGDVFIRARDLLSDSAPH